MRMKSKALAATLVIGACCAAQAASASGFNPAGIYVGAGVGQSNVRNNGYDASNYYGFDNHAAAWQLTAGVRPIAPFGVEYDYINFGSPNDNYGSYSNNGDSTTASALFGVGYLPLPFIDIYAKLGVARLAVNTTVFGPNAPYHLGFTNSDLAYGVGAQLKFSSLALRAEYERINDRAGDADMLAVGVTWTF